MNSSAYGRIHTERNDTHNLSIYISFNQSIQAIPMLLQRHVLVIVVVVSNAFQSEDFEANILLGTHL